MSRPQRYGRDSHFVTDGTVNAVKRIVCTDQWHVKCTRYLPMLQAGAFIHVHDKIHSRKNT